MLDPQLKQMFAGFVLPTLCQLPTEAIIDLRAYLNEQIDAILATRDDGVQSPN